MSRTAAIAVIRSAIGRARRINHGRTSAIPAGQARELGAYMLTPSRAARVVLIGMSCNSSGPVPPLADILEPEFVISTIVIDSSREGVHLGLRDLGTAREKPSTREPWVSYSSDVVASQHRSNMLHWHLRVKPDLAL